MGNSPAGAGIGASIGSGIMGAIMIVGGALTANPFLVAGGIASVASGAVAGAAAGIAAKEAQDARNEGRAISEQGAAAARTATAAEAAAVANSKFHLQQAASGAYGPGASKIAKGFYSAVQAGRTANGALLAAGGVAGYGRAQDRALNATMARVTGVSTYVGAFNDPLQSRMSNKRFSQPAAVRNMIADDRFSGPTRAFFQGVTGSAVTTAPTAQPQNVSSDSGGVPGERIANTATSVGRSVAPSNVNVSRGGGTYYQTRTY